MSVLSGKLCNYHALDILESEYKIHEICNNIKTAHHIWINDLTDDLKNKFLKIKYCDCIINTISSHFTDYKIDKVDDIDEIYWAVSPEDAIGSDRSLVDCHYDSFYVPGKSIFYRIIVALNENNDVVTVFPDDNISVKMNTGDFHGLNYNADKHCVGRLGR